MNNTTLQCHTIYTLIEPPMTYIYFSLYLLLSILATFGNTVALVILWQPSMRSKSNRILSSLVVCDALVGIVLLPFLAYQVFDPSTLSNCQLEIIRTNISVPLIGTSAINVGLVAYDRYILMTKSNNRDTYTDMKMSILVILSWVVPAACVPIRYFNMIAYMFTLCIIILTPMIGLTVFYILITVVVHKNEKKMRNMKHDDINLNDATQKTYQDKNTEKKKRENRRNKLGKKVSVLIICYVICLLPTAIGLIIAMVNFKKPVSFPLQIFFLFARFIAALNSCINPVIYAAKYPKFRRLLLKIIGYAQYKQGGIFTSDSSGTID